MTSFMIKAHVDRQIPQEWQSDADCTFCRIIKNELPSYKVYENDKIIVILDIMPLRPGHMLVIPKAHYSRLSELPEEYASAAGITLTKVANALTHGTVVFPPTALSILSASVTKVLDNTALNVVCNQEYAQAVPHVHYHVIPAPKLHATASPTLIPNALPGAQQETVPRTMSEMHQMEFEGRDSLEDEDAEALVAKLRAKL